jgi:hypothetical protein
MALNFQTTINPFASSLPLAVEGDFCSANVRTSMVAGEGAFVVGVNPVTVGRFAWVNAAGQASNNAAGGLRVGFVCLRGQMVIITPWLGGFGMTVQPGQEITLHDAADVFIRFAGGAAIGQKVFASYADGTAVAGAAGSTLAGSSVTASITSNVMTVTAVGSGTLAPGQPIAGGTTTPGTTIVAQLTGTPGGIGTYSTTTTANVVSGTLTTNGGVETRWFVDSTAAAGELAMCTTRG